MTFITPLFLALSELLIARRPSTLVVEKTGVESSVMGAAMQKVHLHTWQGKLAAALGSAEYRPDLIPLLVHLARLEQHHCDLVTQLDRSRELTVEILARDTIEFDSVIKAEAFTFKIQTAIARALREIQRAEIRLEKAQKPPVVKTISPKVTPSSGSGQQKFPESAVTINDSRPIEQPVVKVGEGSPEPVAPKPTPPTLAPPIATREPIAPAATPQDPLLQSILLRNRHRIKNTPPEKRPALIALLLQQEHAEQEKRVA